MSLKYFHILFIILASLLAFFFAYWCFEEAGLGERSYFAWGVLSFLAGMSLLFYGRSVLKKLKNIGFFMAALWLVGSNQAWACQTCYVDPNHPAAKALTISVLFLMGIITLVLTGFMALIVHYNIRSRSLVNNKGNV